MIDAFVTVCKNRFTYDHEPTKDLYEYFNKAYEENRIKYIYNDKKIIGFLTYFLWTKEQLEERLKNDSTFNFPQSGNNNYLYIDICVVFDDNPMNFLYLRRQFRKEFPQIEYVCWHKTRDKKQLFRIKYDGGN